jgi:predicted GNAT family acetyltransferase
MNTAADTTHGPIEVVHRPAEDRFVAVVDGLESELVYRLAPGRVDFVHTGVPHVLRGRGIAAVLVEAGLAWAQAQGLEVRPVCSYVRSHLQRRSRVRSA